MYIVHYSTVLSTVLALNFTLCWLNFKRVGSESSARKHLSVCIVSSYRLQINRFVLQIGLPSSPLAVLAPHPVSCPLSCACSPADMFCIRMLIIDQQRHIRTLNCKLDWKSHSDSVHWRKHLSAAHRHEHYVRFEITALSKSALVKNQCVQRHHSNANEQRTNNISVCLQSPDVTRQCYSYLPFILYKTCPQPHCTQIRGISPVSWLSLHCRPSV